MVSSLLCTVILLFSLMFYLRIALSFFPAQTGGLMMQVRELAFSVTEPVMLPIRRAVPPMQGAAAGFGVDVIILLIALIVLQGLFCR
ncbi:MAG: YggT family protein [Acidimicrobiales bacterium]|nr:YggT family protein [Acidimicrobiales bacterium]